MSKPLLFLLLGLVFFAYGQESMVWKRRSTQLQSPQKFDSLVSLGLSVEQIARLDQAGRYFDIDLVSTADANFIILGEALFIDSDNGFKAAQSLIRVFPNRAIENLQWKKTGIAFKLKVFATRFLSNPSLSNQIKESRVFIDLEKNSPIPRLLNESCNGNIHDCPRSLMVYERNDFMAQKIHNLSQIDKKRPQTYLVVVGADNREDLSKTLQCDYSMDLKKLSRGFTVKFKRENGCGEHWEPKTPYNCQGPSGNSLKFNKCPL